MRYGILDTVAEPEFDDIVELAASILGASMATVTLIDGDRQWFKAKLGVDLQETPREVSICARILVEPGLTIVGDLTKDPRFASNPFVVGEPGLRFYAGAPLVTPGGVPLGTLCVFDTAARPDGLTEPQARALRALARQVISQLELRRITVDSQAALAAQLASEAGRVDTMQRLAVSEAQLAESEAKFRAITDSIDQMVWSTLPDGYHDFYNQRWYDYTGAPPGSTDGDAWNGMFHPDDQARARATWHHSLTTGEPYRIEYRLRHRSGQYRWVLGRAQPVRNDDGRIVRWYGTCTEIEELVQARDVLARSRRELEREVTRRTAERDQVWRNARDLLLVVDAGGVYRAANQAWARILGWQPHQVVGRTYRELVHPDDQHLAATARPHPETDEVQDFELRMLHRDGGYRAISWVVARLDGVVYASGRDVTEERAAAEALTAAQDQLRQSQKMEAVGQLTGGIAHDFNNMLAVVIGSLDLLRRRLPPDAEQERRYVDAAMEGARRAALLTQRLLAFSRQQPLQPAPVDVNALVAGMMDLLKHAIGPGARLETEPGSGLWRTHADPNQLENVILNLVVNARDALEGQADGGSVTIRTRNATVGTEGPTARPGVPAGDYVQVIVADTGCGMAPEIAARAFDPFFTTKGVGRGTGLGLSQVYGFVNQSGGHVRLQSEPGGGTTVTICLPRLGADHGRVGDAAAGPGLPMAATRLPPPSEDGLLVLVVDDDASVRRFSTEALRALGHRVLEADGGPAALEILARTPGIGLLFTDVAMPDMTGTRLAQEATRGRPGLRVLFTTGFTPGDAVLPEDQELGAHLLRKPFTVDELAMRVRMVVAAG
jgi:PAS domain S-box-containing protein